MDVGRRACARPPAISRASRRASRWIIATRTLWRDSQAGPVWSALRCSSTRGVCSLEDGGEALDWRAMHFDDAPQARRWKKRAGATARYQALPDQICIRATFIGCISEGVGGGRRCVGTLLPWMCTTTSPAISISVAQRRPRLPKLRPRTAPPLPSRNRRSLSSFSSRHARPRLILAITRARARALGHLLSIPVGPPTLALCTPARANAMVPAQHTMEDRKRRVLVPSTILLSHTPLRTGPSSTARPGVQISARIWHSHFDASLAPPSAASPSGLSYPASPDVSSSALSPNSFPPCSL